MTEMDAAADRSALVPGAHRLIRAVDGVEGPFTGALVGYQDGVALRVDVDEIASWGGWAFSDADHVCGVIDVSRRADGHDALLPWCTQRVETFLGRRRAAEVPLASGELGTLVVSLMRGVRELGAESDAVGEWWLTGDGRPLFVHGDGGDVRARTAALIERISGHTTDRTTERTLQEMTAALRERRHHADDDVRWESQLFAVAAPRALRLDVFAPERAADLAPRRTLRLEPDDGRRARRPRSPQSDRTAVRPMLRAVGTALSERAHNVWTRLQRGSEHDRQKPARGARLRRRPLILAGVVAAIVLTAGLMWPNSSEPAPAEAAQEAEKSVPNAPALTPESAQTPAPTPSVEPSPSDEGDPLSVVPALLETVAACVETGSATCAEALVDGLGTPAEGLIARGPTASSATLVDDYGDVAVVKLVPVGADTTAVEQMLVLEQREQKWLVRDVYDIAHQPS